MLVFLSFAVLVMWMLRKTIMWCVFLVGISACPCLHSTNSSNGRELGTGETPMSKLCYSILRFGALGNAVVLTLWYFPPQILIWIGVKNVCTHQLTEVTRSPLKKKRTLLYVHPIFGIHLSVWNPCGNFKELRAQADKRSAWKQNELTKPESAWDEIE